MNFIIRDYREEDYKAVTEVLMKSFKETYVKAFKYEDDMLLEFLQDLQFIPKNQAEGFYVAEAEGQIIGAVVLKWRELKFDRTAVLLRMARKYNHLKLFRAFIGYLAMLERPKKDECYIDNLLVLPDACGQGVGLELLNKADAYAYDKRYDKLTIYIGGEDHGLEAELKQSGFRTKKVYHSRLHRLVLGEGTLKFMTKVPGKKPDQLTIGMFTDTYMPQVNGVATSIKSLADELDRMGHKVYIITIRDEGLTSEFNGKTLRIPGVKVLRGTDYRLANVLMPTDRVNRIIRSMNLDVIHTHTEFSIGLLGTYFGRRDKIPHIHTYHTMYDDFVYAATNFRPAQHVAVEVIKTYVKEFTDECNKVIVPTDKTRDVLTEYGVETELVTIPTGIDFKKFVVDEKDQKVMDLKEKLSIEEDDFVCMNIGRLSKEKQVDAIVKNVMALTKDYPKLKFIVIGDGPELEPLKALAKGYEKQIIFLGRVPWEEIGYYYKLGDAFIVASRFETQGLTVIEALSSSVPVICPDDEAFISIVEEGVNGMIFTDNDQIKEKIEAVMVPETYEVLLSNAANSVIKYSSEYFAETVLAEYSNL